MIDKIGEWGNGRNGGNFFGKILGEFLVFFMMVFVILL